jgi:Ca-activated chloride channel family protein
LPKSESQARLVKRYYERYHWPLALAIALLLLEIFLRERRRSPKPVPARSLPASSAATTALLLCLIGAGTTQASVSSAQRAYTAGRYEEAMKEYEKLAEQKPDDPRLIFNAGDAAYRGTNFAAAKGYFTAVLNARDLKLQQSAYYNLGNTQYRLGEIAEDLDAIQAQWEEAIKSFQLALQLDKNDANAAHNLALSQKGVEQIKLLRELAKQARESAEEHVRRRNYRRALETMQQLLQQNPAAKPFQDFTKKLQDIDAIANPNSN